MQGKFDNTVKGTLDNTQEPSSAAQDGNPFKLLFRKRTRSNPERGFIPDEHFNPDEYDLKDTGMPGFKALIAKKARQDISTNESADSMKLASSDTDTQLEYEIDQAEWRSSPSNP